MSFIGEAIATVAIEVLFKKLASTKLLQFASRENIHADLKKWEDKLLKIKAVLNDAAEKQLESRLVRDWLTDLKNLAYHVEDILDEFATEALKRELSDEPHASTSCWTSCWMNLIPSCFTALSPQSIKFNDEMASQIKEITDRLEEIVEQKNSLQLKEIPGENSFKVKYQNSPESTSLHDPYICGRENDKKAILDMLFKDEGTSTSVGVPVISIFGMGGLGKTTLAQLVYNDEEVDKYFNFQAWAYVSEDFDIARVTKIVLQSIAPGTGDGNNLNLLQVQLKEKLDGKKFLIVLDDVWLENYQDWTTLCLPFQAGSFGSKIIITTRKESVALMAEANNGSVYRLEQLSNDNCLSLFTFHALGKTDFNEHPDLKEIGEKIVDRCKGLPLAAKTLGGLLRCKFRNKDWEDLLDSRIWNLSEEESGILPALRVSYNYLSPPLQRCFAYCSIFPKGHVFVKKEIILLWMAEGFLQTDRNEEQAEDIGDEFLENLYSISFFQQSSWSIFFSGFVMHDLIHDLAQWAAEDFCLKVDNVSKDEKKLKISKNLHHLSFVNVGSICECIKKLEASDEVIKSIRTFLSLPVARLLVFPSRCDFLNLIPRLRRLRVLSLKGYQIGNLLDTICDLKHLRYLDLSYTEIEKLPDSINTLYNLEILKLEGCSRLVNLCSDMGNLINLRHLYYYSKAFSMERMPSGIGRLIRLRTLPFYLVGKDVGFGLKELKKLTHLQDKFQISGLENVNDIGDAKEADIIGKEKLRELELEWTSSFSDSRDIGIETRVLDMLQPYNKLEKLTIMSYGGTKFPSWLADTSLSKLVLLRFEDCKNCTSLPPIGQLPLLKDLYIKGLAGIKSISPEFYGNGCSTPFQSLEVLRIEDMQEWKDWNHLGFGKDNVGFPRLRELSIERCPKLSGNLPPIGQLPLLKDLYIKGLAGIKSISPEFYGNGCSTPFQSLEVLSIEDMQEWKDWNHLGFGKDNVGFPCLRELSIEHCPKLSGNLPELFPLLERLSISSCEQLRMSIPSLPKDCNIEISGCKEVRWTVDRFLPNSEALFDISGGVTLAEFSLKTIEIVDYEKPTYILRDLKHSDSISFHSFAIHFFDIIGCHLPDSIIECLMKLEQGLTSRLQYLRLWNCECLMKLPQVLHSLSFLRGLSIEDCPKLVSIPDSALPSELRFIGIKYCNALQSLPKSWMQSSNTSLEELSIECCDSLTDIAGIMQSPNLKKFTINVCPGLASFPEDCFPTNLTSLTVGGVNICKAFFEWGLHRLTSLEVLDISNGCPDMISFPMLPTSLTTLCINDFRDLERLSPNFQDLSSLEVLDLQSCPNLKSFPEKGLPSSLQQLLIYECPLLEQSCEKDKGLYWPMIALVPEVHIDGIPKWKYGMEWGQEEWWMVQEE